LSHIGEVNVAKPQSTETFNIVDDKIASAIGRVAINWSVIEFSHILLILEITDNNNPPGYVLLAEASLMQRQYMIKSLLHYSRKVEWAVEWRDIEQKVNDLRIERNDIIHGYWVEHFEAGTQVSRLKARTQLQAGFMNRNLASIVDVSKKILQSSEDIEAFRRKLLADDVVARLKQPLGPFIQGPIPSQQSLAQDQSRSQKRARKQADRNRDGENELVRKKKVPS